MFDAIAELVEDPRYFDKGYLRHKMIPSPNDCAVCGDDPRYHGGQYAKRQDGTSGIHYYEAPSNALRLLRMKARALLRLEAGRKPLRAS